MIFEEDCEPGLDGPLDVDRHHSSFMDTNDIREFSREFLPYAKAFGAVEPQFAKLDFPPTIAPIVTSFLTIVTDAPF